MTAAPEDILDGFAQLWAVAGLPGVVTGGLHGHGLPAGTPLPFALVRVMPAAKQTYSGPAGGLLESFTVTAWVHTAEGTGQRRAVGRLLPAIDFSQRKWPAQFGRCLHVRPLPAPTDPSSVQASLARDGAVTAAAWEVLVQQTRAVSM
jgi:hypothetical protein